MMQRFQMPPNTQERIAEIFVTDGLGSRLKDEFIASDTRRALDLYQSAQRRHYQSAIRHWGKEYQALNRRDTERALHGEGWIACATCEPRQIIVGTETDVVEQAIAELWEQHGDGWYCRACLNHFEGYAKAKGEVPV